MGYILLRTGKATSTNQRTAPKLVAVGRRLTFVHPVHLALRVHGVRSGGRRDDDERFSWTVGALAGRLHVHERLVLVGVVALAGLVDSVCRRTSLVLPSCPGKSTEPGGGGADGVHPGAWRTTPRRHSQVRKGPSNSARSGRSSSVHRSTRSGSSPTGSVPASARWAFPGTRPQRRGAAVTWISAAAFRPSASDLSRARRREPRE